MACNCFEKTAALFKERISEKVGDALGEIEEAGFEHSLYNFSGGDHSPVAMNFKFRYYRKCVSALLEDNERVARDLVARNGEIEGLRKRAAELEKRLATPVRLPNKNDDEFWFDGVFQVAKFDRAVERAIRAAGFTVTVEGDA